VVEDGMERRDHVISGETWERRESARSQNPHNTGKCENTGSVGNHPKWPKSNHLGKTMGLFEKV
jgi:hypothetical protein